MSVPQPERQLLKESIMSVKDYAVMTGNENVLSHIAAIGNDLNLDLEHRYSDAVPYDARKYWYFTLHGTGPGTLPKGINVLETRDGKNEKGTMGVYVCIDAVLNTSELNQYGLKELTPPENEIEFDER